jgi:hypothetical protein
MKDKNGNQTGRRVVSVRMCEASDFALTEGLNRLKISQPAYIRLAVIEKNERDKKCK